MKSTVALPVVVWTCCLLAGCATALPKVRPADLTVALLRSTAQTGEGKPYLDELHLSGSGESYYRIEYGGGGTISVPLEIEQKLLDELYALLRKSHIDRFRTTADAKAPKKGAWVKVGFAGSAFWVPKSASALPASWAKVVSTLESLKKTEVDEKGYGIPAEFDDSIFGAGYPEQKPGD